MYVELMPTRTRVVARGGVDSPAQTGSSSRGPMRPTFGAGCSSRTRTRGLSSAAAGSPGRGLEHGAGRREAVGSPRGALSALEPGRTCGGTTRRRRRRASGRPGRARAAARAERRCARPGNEIRSETSTRTARPRPRPPSGAPKRQSSTTSPPASAAAQRGRRRRTARRVRHGRRATRKLPGGRLRGRVPHDHALGPSPPLGGGSQGCRRRRPRHRVRARVSEDATS